MGQLFAMVRRVNRLMNQGLMDAAQVEQVLAFVASANRVLGVMNLEPPAGDADIEQMVKRRDAARTAGDFALADKLRDELAARGCSLSILPPAPAGIESISPASRCCLQNSLRPGSPSTY